MKDFSRGDLSFSLCGLNCALCVMKLDGYCPGCGGGSGNQGCAIARCALKRGVLGYCYACGEYPCEKYEGITAFDSFITHRNQLSDMEKARAIGPSAYGAELAEKAALMKRLLEKYNDGRRKTLFCLAANLLDSSDLRCALAEIEGETAPETPLKEKALIAQARLENAAERKGVQLKLRKVTPRARSPKKSG